MPGLEDIHKKGLRERGVTKYRQVENKKEGRGVADGIRNKVFDWLQDQPGFSARQRDIIAAKQRAGSEEKPGNTMSLLTQLGYPPLSGGDPRFLARKEFGVYQLWIATERKPPKRKNRKAAMETVLRKAAKKAIYGFRKNAKTTTVTKKTITKKTATSEAKPKGTRGNPTVKAISNKKQATEKKGLFGFGVLGL
jgi:hypothetical protein